MLVVGDLLLQHAATIMAARRMRWQADVLLVDGAVPRPNHRKRSQESAQ